MRYALTVLHDYRLYSRHGPLRLRMFFLPLWYMKIIHKHNTTTHNVVDIINCDVRQWHFFLSLFLRFFSIILCYCLFCVDAFHLGLIYGDSTLAKFKLRWVYLFAVCRQQHHNYVDHFYKVWNNEEEYIFRSSHEILNKFCFEPKMLS